MTRRLVLIVGLQKSGTTLLSRLLQESGLVRNPFRTEGNDFWGNEPPFAPTGFPAGHVYQRFGGEEGHEIGAEHADPETARVLTDRLRTLAPGNDLIVNKNPYNSVRLQWLRVLFPEAVIVSLVRDPVANVFSLAKKHVPHDQSGLPPEEGWWGVKPRGWRALRCEDRALQCARQWSTVNRTIARDRDALDAVYAYPDVCARPGEIVAEIVERCTGSRPRVPVIEPLRCFDDEVGRGSRLRSKNRYFKESASLDTPESEPIEFPAFDEATVRRVEAACAETKQELTELP